MNLGEAGRVRENNELHFGCDEGKKPMRIQ